MFVWTDGKGPGEEEDFDVDWTIRLAGDTITSSSWEIVGTDPATPEDPVALQIMTDPAASFSSPYTKVWLSGGTLGVTYILRNTITTIGGENPMKELVELPMRNR